HHLNQFPEVLNHIGLVCITSKMNGPESQRVSWNGCLNPLPNWIILARLHAAVWIWGCRWHVLYCGQWGEVKLANRNGAQRGLRVTICLPY
ncbi:MAG: hypothetical protein ACPGSM_21160, partial [Thiolinea sp.]